MMIGFARKAFGVMTTSSRRLLAISPQVFQLPVRLPTSFVRQLATVPQSGNVVPTKPATYAVFVELSHVKRKIIDIESSIQAIEATIQDVESQLNLCVESQLNVAQRLDDSDPKKAGEVQYLRAKETQLRAKETQLRAEKIQLRATVAELRKEAVLLRGKAEPQFQQNSNKSLAELATYLLPPPIEFKEQMVGDTKMMVALTSAKSTVWLEPDSFKKVADFLNTADNEVGYFDQVVSAPAAPLVLVGPVKCSKSTMLDVIPGILSQRYHLNIAAGRSPRLPVVLKWNISPFDDPSLALISLRGSIELLALELGIEVPSGMTFSSLAQSIDSTKTMFCQFVKEAAARNICVWLYVDEIQAPVLHAIDSFERMLFVYFIKNLVDQARLHSRVVLTGSSMHSFLHQVRSLAVNGFSLWNNSKFVMLGRPLSESCVKAIGETIFSYHLQERKKQSLVGNTFDELLEQIKLNDQFSLSMTARPAVLNDIIATIPDSGDFAAGAKHSIDLLANKIQKETTKDIGKLFSEMRSNVHTLTFFRQVACGQSGSSGDMSIDRFILVLCGQDPDSLTSNSSQRQLVLPYSAIFQNFLTETGEFTVPLEDISQTAYLVPCDCLRSALDFFVVSQKSKLFSPGSKKRISRAMMKRALDLNLGVPKQTGSTELKEFTSVRQLLECPKILAMRIENFENHSPNLLSDPDRLQKVQEMIDKEKQSKEEPGMYLERLFRNFISHNIANMIKTLHRLNWSLTDIYSLVRASVIALQKEQLDWVVFDKNGWPSAAVQQDAVQPGNSVAP